MPFNLNPPLWARTVLYFVATIGLLVQKWAEDEHWLDGPTDDLITGLLALVLALAVGNGVAQVAASTQRRRRKRTS